MSDALISLKNEIGPTFNMVTDLRYKVSCKKGHSSENIWLSLNMQEGIEKVEAAYAVFFKNSLEDFQHFSFELQTVAEQSLTAERIKSYLGKASKKNRFF